MWHGLIEDFAASTGVAVRHVPRSVDLSSLEEALRDDVVAIVSLGLRAEAVRLFPSLRLVAIPMAGINTMPVAALREGGVQLANAHANGMWVAERAVALALGFMGDLLRGDRDMRHGVWHGFAAGEPATATWHSMFDTTVAILGTGSIGRWIARLLTPFGVTCRGLRRSGGTEGLPEGLFASVGTDLAEVVKGVDLVFATLPLTPETRGMIGRDELAAMAGSIVVNVGRGEVIDEEALYDALRSGVVAGAALDTWYQYPDPAGSRQYPSRFPFHELDNVLMSPHLGGYTASATAASAREVVDTVARWIGDGAPAGAGGTVDLEAGY
jgi:phosphoglycerate dehydrogenase-like enzyme